jgi:uncharacterized membrane protein YhhN
VTDAAWAFLAVAAVFAVGDWVAVGRKDTRLEYLCKPASTLALAGVAATLDAAHGDRQAWFIAAVVLSLAGDVFLMLPQDRFVPGLASFLLAHVAYTVGFALHGGDAGDYALGAAIVVLAVAPLATRFLGALRRSGDRALLAPVTIYIAAIAAMGASAIASGNAWAIAGAALFITSDALIAETRFVAPRSWGRLAIMVTYHLGQTGLVLSLI